jgi:hypothetical protein
VLVASAADVFVLPSSDSASEAHVLSAYELDAPVGCVVTALV